MGKYKAVHSIVRAGEKKDGRGNPVHDTVKPGTIINVSGDEEKELLAAGAIAPHDDKLPAGAVGPSSAVSTIPKERTSRKPDPKGADTSKVIDNLSDPAKAMQAGMVQGDAGSVAGDAERVSAAGGAPATSTEASATGRTTETRTASKTARKAAPAASKTAAKSASKTGARKPGRPRKSDGDLVG